MVQFPRPVRLVGALLVCGAVALGATGSAKDGPPEGVTLLPESERPFNRVIIGLDPLLASPYMLPKGSTFDGLKDPRVAFVRRQLYWLSFELMHGAIVDAVPEWSKIFVAAPDPRLHAKELGDEREEFRQYLRTRRKWTAAKIAGRVRFFTVGLNLPFPRDIAEPIGHDRKGRLVLGLGAESDLVYREAAQAAVKAFPAEFALQLLPGVNTEGGDLELIRQPDGKLGLLLGHHRIRRWLEYRYGEGILGRSVGAERIAEAKEAFRKAFFGLDVLVVNEEGLKSPSLVTDELFHSDMIVNIVRGSKGMVAFVPSYEGGPVDSISREPLSPEMTRRAQAVYDRAAAALAAKGFRVARLPFADHPVRNPVNVGRFLDKNGAAVVLLGKYPYHFALPDGSIPQRELQKRLDDLSDELLAWKETPSAGRWDRVKKSFATVWAEMDRAAASPNPTFERQARVYAAEGVRVIPVPIYPTGEGGLHCLSLAGLLDGNGEGGVSLASFSPLLP